MAAFKLASPARIQRKNGTITLLSRAWALSSEIQALRWTVPFLLNGSLIGSPAFYDKK